MCCYDRDKLSEEFDLPAAFMSDEVLTSYEQ